MRITSFMLFFCTVLMFAENSYSQKARVTIKQRDAKLETVLNEIENQTDYLFLYNGNQIDANKNVSVNVKNIPVNELLTEIFSGSQVKYMLEGTHIILTTNDHDVSSVSLQTIPVTGIVSSVEGEPMPGVNVIIKGSTIGVITDTDGKYTINVSSKDAILVFSFMGYISQEMIVGDRTNIDIHLNEDIHEIEEVIVVGYGTVKKKDLTGSIQRVDASKFETQSKTNLLEMLSGTVAGFISNQGTSAQGGGSMLIRGQTSLKASNNPLIVLDGVIYTGSTQNINPADVESIDILKDASSAAVYGARAASGVMIITTKRGRSGKPMLNFSTELGITTVRRTMRSFSPEEYIVNRGQDCYQTYGDKPLYYYSNPYNLPDGITLDDWLNLDSTISDDPIDLWLNRLRFTNTEKKNYLTGKTVDWLDEVFRTGFRQDYSLSASGGSQYFKYYFSGGYTDNQGIVVGDNFSIFRTRINLDMQATNFLKINADVNYSHGIYGSQSASVENAMVGSPYGEIYADDGSMTWYTNEDLTSPNPLIISTYRDKYNPQDALFATISAELSLPFGIKYKPSFVNYMRWSMSYQFDPIETATGYNNKGTGFRNNTTNKDWMVDNLFTWHKVIQHHDINLTFLYNIEKNQVWSNQMSNTQFSPNDALSYHALHAGSNPSITVNDEVNTGNALMGRINYSYRNRYMLTLTLRRDGYSAFGMDNPYATFPSAAIAWRISDEKFFNVNAINHLKIRLSWGANGNRSVGAYDALSRLSTIRYIYGTDAAIGVYSSTMANSSLRWESTEAFNAGVDFDLFNNRLSGTLDAYSMKTTDLLVDRTLPPIIGYSNVSSNLGEIVNKGIELTLNSININNENFKWSSSLVFSFNRNKIKHLYGDMEDVLDDAGNVIGQKEADDMTNEWFIGQSIDRVWDYERLGIWQIDEADIAKKYGKTPGDLKLRDQNEDGVMNTKDKVFQGYKKPQYRLGLRNDIRFLKNFEFSFFIRADIGFCRANPLYLEMGGISRKNVLYAPYWTEDNPSNEYPKLRAQTASPALSVWRNSSFVRLQDISLSYDIPVDMISRLKMQRLRMYVNLRNPITITNWNHWDPESGTSPMPWQLTIGLNVNF